MNNNFNNFNNMDDLFNQLMGGMRGYSSENRRYLINGREVTPEEFAHYRATGQLPGNAETDGQMPQHTSGMKQDGVLAKLGRNLTAEAREGKLDPVIGRNKEIQETSEILSRRTKNNPVLVGDAGVGKTAVVEGLAQAIVNGDVPAAIKNKEIISIDISGLEAGTQYRGSFEENVQNLVNEVKEAGNIILFFDEIHQILGAGSTGGDSGSKGLADILKPALSRGELTVIGATTQDEYRNTILKNAALARRFNEVKVNAPSAEDTYKILQGIRDLYQQHHNVILPDEVLKAAVDYSIQYIPQRSLPDKAIDLVDVTAAHLAAQHPVTDVHAVEREIEVEKDKQEKAVEAEDFEAALNAKTRIAELEKKVANHTEDMKVTASINDVAESVERMTGIPVSQMGASDIERLKDMAHRLEHKVIGQDKAVEAVARAIRRNRAGFDEGNRPIGSFLFVGPTGVGKTELAKQLALDMFGTKDAIIRLDMSEYSDRTAVSKLIGTTAGYVGYDDNSNTLTERVRRNPYSIILLDEIEKADPQVITLLLQVLDDGRLTDGQGNTVNFKNTVIIATSNAGFGYEANLTEDADKPELMDRLKDKVIGQDKAVEAVARAIRRNRAGFDEGNRPIGSFLFVGPTGVGKTELAKQLALDMFGTKDAIIRLDMSEYSDRTAVSKLIGTTAGYVGYDDNSNTLTERVRRNPYSIILLDEIEKADPQVITLLLQVLDDGRLTDGQGNTVNFKNTVIIATSNAGFGYEANLTEDADKPELMDRLKPYFRPEFLNRFNAVIEFSHLNKEDLSKIVDLMLAEVNQTLAKKDIDLEVSQAAKDFITEEGYDEVMGVRPLRRVVEQQIRDKVTDFHLDHLDAKHLEADMEDGGLVIREKA